MKNLIMAGIVGVILFAASASVSWYLMNQNKKAEDDAVAKVDPEAEAGVPPIDNSKQKEEKMPVALRPTTPLTQEAVLELSRSITRKERQLIEREKLAERTEQNIRLLFEDLKVERAQLTELAAKIESRLQQAQGSVVEMKQENQVLTTQTQELAKLKQKNAKNTDNELDEIGQRVKTAKPWFEGLEDEQAANYLKEFANNGEMEFAARLLKSLQQRQASKILAAFNDPDFVQQILDALSTSKKEKDEDGGVANKGFGGRMR